MASIQYQDLLIQEDEEFKIKSEEQLTAEKHSVQWFSCPQLKERFNIDKRIVGIEKHKTGFQHELSTNDEHVIAKTYTFLLRVKSRMGKNMGKWDKIYIVL